MNLGTAGDIRNIDGVVSEVMRILKPGGRFLLSFYNRDALIYQWDFLPWQAGLAAVINTVRDSLDVISISQSEDGDKPKREEIIPIYARARSINEIRSLFCDLNVEVATYPAIMAVLPNEILSGSAEVRQAIASLDQGLVHTNMGAYAIVTGAKL